MPFTPIHMGPGMAVKALAGRHFSLVGFGVAQVLIDIEPLVRIIRGDAMLHGPTHTYLGALVIAMVAAPLGYLAYPILARIWRLEFERGSLRWLSVPPTASGRAMVAGALVGTLSHVALDSIMHSDMTPLAPFLTHNRLLGWVSIDQLHVGCLVLGVAGLAIWIVRRWWVAVRAAKYPDTAPTLADFQQGKQ